MSRMMCGFVAALALLSTATSAVAGGPTATETNKVDSPPGWFLTGSEPEAYAVGVDDKVKHGGKAAAFLKSIKDPGDDFGTLMQTISAKKYRGKRVRLAAWIKTDKVDGWAGLWMRVDGKSGNTLAFDNMDKRSIKGTTDWARHEVVLDVDKGAESISFGTLLVEAGALWIDDVVIETVAKSVATTNEKASIKREAPENLDFEK